MIDAAAVKVADRATSLVVVCPAMIFRLVWIAILLTHVACGASLIVQAAMTQLTLLPELAGAVAILKRMGVDWDPIVMRTAVLLYLILASMHLICAFLVIKRSLRARMLTFNARLTATSSSWCQCFIWLLTAPRRWFGVRGRYFTVAFIIRESLEIGAQTYQGYRNSKYVARLWLNQLSVIVLVLNCWSTPLVHWIQHRRRSPNVATTRMCCLGADIVLDLIMVTVIPSLIALPYAQLAAALAARDATAVAEIANPSTIVQAKAELQILTVTTWPTLLAQIVQSLSILQVLDDIKSLLHRRKSISVTNAIKLSVAPDETKLQKEPFLPAIAIRRRELGRLMQTLHLIFVIMGFVIAIVAHKTFVEDATTHAAPCRLPMHPWLSNRVTCSYVVVDCRHLSTGGSEGEIVPLLNVYEPNDVAALAFVHCRHLEMPSTIARMSALLTIQVYNSTLISWGADVAIQSATHPWFYQVLIYLVNLDAVGNTLPPGLLSDTIPSTLVSLIVSHVNLSALSSDFSKKWQHDVVDLILDQCDLSAIPDVTVSDIFAVPGNYQLTELPTKLLGGPSILVLNDNQRMTLPSNVTHLVSSSISIQNTTIAKIPDWVFDGNTPFVWAWNTPVCPDNATSKMQATLVVCERNNIVMNSTCGPAFLGSAQRVEFASVQWRTQERRSCHGQKNNVCFNYTIGDQ